MSEKEKSENNETMEQDISPAETETAEEKDNASAEKSVQVEGEKTSHEKEDGKEEKAVLSRKSKHRTTSIVLTALVLAGVIIINVIAGVLTDRFSGLTADITSSGIYHLTDATEKVVSGLKKKVSITFLTEKNTYSQFDTYYKQTLLMVDNMAKDSGGLITVNYTDIISNPTFLNNYQDENLTTSDIIVKCGEKYNVLHKEDLYNFEYMNNTYQYITSSKAESAIDTAIVKVTSEKNDKIVMIADHAEDDYSYLVRVLTANNYDVQQVSLENDAIPKDVNTVIVYAPTKDYTEEQVKKLRDFLNNDNNYSKNMIYISTNKDSELENIETVLQEYGMAMSNGLAFDMDTSRQMNSQTSYGGYGYIAASFASRLYTDNIPDDGQTILVNRSRGIASIDSNATQALVTYSSKSGICPYDLTGDWDPEEYITGNVPVIMQGVTGDNKVQSKVIACGTTEMWDRVIMESQFVNQEYFINMVGTLYHRQSDAIRVEDKVITEYAIENISRQSAIVTGVLLFAVMPMLIISAGVAVFVVRRRR